MLTIVVRRGEEATPHNCQEKADVGHLENTPPGQMPAGSGVGYL